VPIGRVMVVALVALIASVSLELELSGGLVSGSGEQQSSSAPVLRTPVGVDLADHFLLGASLLGVAGREQMEGSACPSPCPVDTSFRASAAFASARMHGSGDLQGFLEGGIGVGHLISLSGSDLFENPPLHGRGGLAYLVGAGARYFLFRQVAVGASVAWTLWTNVEQSAHSYGATRLPARGPDGGWGPVPALHRVRTVSLRLVCRVPMIAARRKSHPAAPESS